MGTDRPAGVFSLGPHFYQTPSFYGLCVVVLIGTVSAAYRLRLNRAKTRGAELLRLVEERTSQLQQANDHLQRLSYMDAVTNIANRRHFEEILEVEWRRAFRAKSPVALLMLDIDHFKIYNDTYGHPAGDKLLRSIAQILRRWQASGDLVARYGGEEFAVLIQDATPQHAASVAEEIRATIAAQEFLLRQGIARVTVSIGAALFPQDGLQREALLQATDERLYLAKASGRNRVCAA